MNPCFDYCYQHLGRQFGTECAGCDYAKAIMENGELKEKVRKMMCVHPTCETCEEFDTAGYDNTILGAAMQIGYCNHWRRSSQACEYCSNHSKLGGDNNA